FYDDFMARDNATAPQVHIYVAGFPCQSFAAAGKQRGLDDARGTVFFGCADYIRAQRPRVFLLENVKGLLTNDG
ncbi:unnamed protein product, partial [Durusdinium trenchii]